MQIHLVDATYELFRAHFSPRPEENTTLFSEIADLAQIDYHAFDICPAPKTDIFDLNFDSLSQKHREHYDVVLNFGTTEPSSISGTASPSSTTPPKWAA